jgi:HPt (histidine-containing phosphotransfer) domain-containing protein
MPPNDELLDQEDLLNRLGDDQKLLEALIGMFHQQAPQEVAAIRDTLRRGDPSRLRFTAHSLKNTVGCFSMGNAYWLAYRLEKMGERGDLTDAAKTFTELETAVAQLGASLSRLLQEPS